MSSSTKVLHVTEALGGGVQSAIAHFIDQTPEIDHVIYGRIRAGEWTIASKNVQIIAHDGGPLSFMRRFRSVLSDSSADAVHFHSSVAGILRPLARGRRVVYSPHCYAFQRKDISRITSRVYKLAERVLARFTDCVVAVSPFEAELARQLDPSRSVVAVSNLTASSRPAPRNTPRPPTVVTVGRIAPQKDPGLFAEVAKLCESIASFVWIGDGDVRLRAELEEMGVEVTGWLSQNEIRDRLQTSSLYLHTASWEASPMSLAEALSMDLPIICRTEASLESLGYHCAGDNASALSDEVFTFFADLDSQRSITRITQNARLALAAVPTGALLRQAYRFGPDDAADGAPSD